MMLLTLKDGYDTWYWRRGLCVDHYRWGEIIVLFEYSLLVCGPYRVDKDGSSHWV